MHQLLKNVCKFDHGNMVCIVTVKWNSIVSLYEIRRQLQQFSVQSPVYTQVTGPMDTCDICSTCLYAV